ncbi:hypothetical protein ACHAQK_012227 [Fusarium lateritium]
MSAEPQFAALYENAYNSAKQVFNTCGQWPPQTMRDSVDRASGKNTLEKLAKLVASVKKSNTNIAHLVQWLKRPLSQDETESSRRKRVSHESREPSPELDNSSPRVATTLPKSRQAHLVALDREISNLDELVATTTLAASETRGQITTAEEKLAGFHTAESEQQIAAAGDEMTRYEKRRLHHQRYRDAYTIINAEASDQEDIPGYHDIAYQTAQGKANLYAQLHSESAAVRGADAAKPVEAGNLRDQIAAWKGELVTHQTTIDSSRKRRENTAVYIAAVELGPEGVENLTGEDSLALKQVLGVE